MPKVAYGSQGLCFSKWLGSQSSVIKWTLPELQNACLTEWYPSSSRLTESSFLWIISFRGGWVHRMLLIDICSHGEIIFLEWGWIWARNERDRNEKGHSLPCSAVSKLRLFSCLVYRICGLYAIPRTYTFAGVIGLTNPGYITFYIRPLGVWSNRCPYLYNFMSLAKNS